MEAFGKMGRSVPTQEYLRRISEHSLNGGIALDAFSNPAARIGYGTPSLPEGAQYELTRISLNYWLMLTLYRNHWLARKIVDGPAEDMIRTWPKVKSSLDPEDIKRIDACIARTQTRTHILRALKWGRLYGGAGALIVIKSQENYLEDPLDLDAIELDDFQGVIPFDRWIGIYPDTTNIASNPDDPIGFGYPEYFVVKTPGLDSFRVHASRILRFDGPSVPTPELEAQSYWGISVLEPVFEELKRYDNVMSSIVGLIFRSQIFAQVNPELARIQSGAGASQAGQQLYYSVMQAQNWLMSNQSTLLLPKDGSLQSFQYAFSGLADVVQQVIQLNIAGAAQYPVARLFGRTISGLGQTNDADERVYEEYIAKENEYHMRPQFSKLYPVICMSELGEVPDDLDYDFPTIRVMTEEEKAELASKWTASVIEAFNANIISQQMALKELQQSSHTTQIFSNITTEDIEKADDDVVQMGEVPAGEELNVHEPNPKRTLEGNDSIDEYRNFGPLALHIEYPAGTWRILHNDKGNVVYKCHLQYDYGEIEDTIGRDGDPIDVIVGRDQQADRAWIVDMKDLGPDVHQRQDEDKVCLGFHSAAEAKQAFLSMYPPSFFNGMKEMTLSQFAGQMKNDAMLVAA